MAESDVEQNQAARKYFCHECSSEIFPLLPEYMCPTCNGGFIEELGQQAVEDIDDSVDDEEDMDPVQGFGNQWGQVLLSALSSPGQQPGQPQLGGLENIIVDVINNITGGSFRIGAPGGTGGGGGPGVPFVVNLAGNPGDYVWGRGGLDAIITQLLNQFEGSGSPPMSKEKINEIPITKISKEQIDRNLQCTVCMEDFVLNEEVRKLSCDHHFHSPCIVPWLELHSTCPVCRVNISGNPDNNRSHSSSSSSGSSHQSNTTTSGNTSTSSGTTGGSTSYSSSSYQDLDFD